MDWVNPAAILILGALLLPLLKGKARQAVMLLLPVGAFAAVAAVAMNGEGTYGVFNVLGQELVFGRVDKLSIVFGYVFSIAAFIGMLYGLGDHKDNPWHHTAALIYAGGAMGVTFVGDYLSLFLFWEVMAFSSVFLILFNRKGDSYDAAYRYVLIHVFGGVCLLGGLILQFTETQSMVFDQVNFGGPAAALILIGFMVNAAVWPFNAWLPDAYPRATVVGAVFMSAFTTKSAVYVLARGFAGTEILIFFGVVMAVYGVVYAMMENDIRRVQSYSIISQVGYMVVGVGIGTELAINGVVAHAFAHILYKGLLFMATGAILYQVGRTKMTELGGLARSMPMTFIFYMVGALAISAFPFFSGFISKSIILSAAGGEHMTAAWVLLTMAAAGTFLYTGLKLPYLVFIKGTTELSEQEAAEGREIKDPPTNMLMAMGIGAFLCVFLGLFPGVLYHILPYAFEYHPYTGDHVVWSLELLFFAAAGFYLLRGRIKAVEGQTLDTDWFYRKGGSLFLSFARKIVAAGDDIVSNAYKVIILKATKGTASASFSFDKSIIDGIVNGVGRFVMGAAARLRTLQTGQLQHYGLAILIGLFILLNLLFFMPVDYEGSLVPRFLLNFF